MTQGSPATGIVVFVVGFVIVALGLLAPVPGGLPRWPAVAAGSLLAVLGVAIAVKELMRPPPAPAPKAATQAFLEKQRHALPAPRAEAAVAPAPAAAASAPAPSTPLDEVEEELRAVMKELGKAKVMFGTGKLSSDGYRTFVADLEKRRADLEARRARILMGKAE